MQEAEFPASRKGYLRDPEPTRVEGHAIPQVVSLRLQPSVARVQARAR